MLHGRYAFDAADTQQLVVYILSEKISDLVSEHLSPLSRAFILGLCEEDERKRLSAAAALTHPWLISKEQRNYRKTSTDPSFARTESTEISRSLKVTDVAPEKLRELHRQFSTLK